MNLTFHGVRGSTPCSSGDTARYGGNTSCVVVEAPGARPILLDLGTGVRGYGLSLCDSAPFRGVALLSHLHWDHLQGLPFFGPVLRPGSLLELYAPRPGQGQSLDEALAEAISPPYFPVGIADLPGEIRCQEIGASTLEVGSATVTSAEVPHVGPTCGFRIDWRGVSVAYVPDHQQPANAPLAVDDAVLELCAGVDLLIHDAQYTPEEFKTRSDWGHSTIEYSVEVARQAGARRLALFHHDPTHSDCMLDALLAEARVTARGALQEIVSASEGLTLSFPARR
ncbi:MAG: MBL fold metallo-hydrolase [Acidimicrobiales bacterium]